MADTEQNDIAQNQETEPVAIDAASEFIFPEVENTSNTAEGFADILLPIVSSSKFQELPLSQKTALISDLYRSKDWDRDTYDIVKQTMTNLLNAADPDDFPDFGEIIGGPPITSPDGNPVEETNKWEGTKVQELLRNDINPAFFGNQLDDYFKQAKEGEIEAFKIRNRTSFGKVLSTTGNIVRDLAQGATYNITKPIAGIARTTFNAGETANVIESLPEYLGKSPNDYLYETDDNGYIAFDEDGTPKTKATSFVAETVGQVLGLLGGGGYLQALKFTNPQIFGIIGSTNALMLANDSYKHVYETTGGDREKALTASVFSLPAAGLGALGELSVISKFVNPAVKGLSTFNKLKYLTKTASRGAVVSGASTGVMDVTMQAGEISQTGQEFDPKRFGLSVIAGTIGGTVATGISGIKNIEQVQAIRTTTTKGIRELQEFQLGLETTSKLSVPAKFIPKEISDLLGVNVAEGTDGRAVVTKKGVVESPIVESDKFPLLLETLKTKLTPSELNEASVERSNLLNKAKIESEEVAKLKEPILTETEQARLNELDSKLSVLDDSEHINKIKETERLIAGALKKNPELLPEIKYDKETREWVNTKTNERRIFLKDILYPEEAKISALEEAKGPLQVGRFRILPARKPLGEEFTKPTIFTRQGEEKVAVPQVKKAIRQLSNILTSLKGRTSKVTERTGGRQLTKNALGTYTDARRQVRIKYANDVPSLVHEYTHHVDTVLDNLSLNSSATDSTVKKGFTEQSATFYPAKVSGKNAIREGLTMFLQNYVTGQPVHTRLLEWWNTDVKASHPEIHAQYEVIRDIAHKYFDQKPEHFITQFREGEVQSRVQKTVEALKNPYVWALHWFNNERILRELDKDTGLASEDKFDSQAHKVPIKVNELMNESVSDFNGNKIPGAYPLKDILNGVKGKVDKFYNYLVAKRALAYSTKNLEGGLPLKDAYEYTRDIETNHPDVLVAAQRWYDLWTAIQDIAAERSPRVRDFVNAIRKINQETTGEAHGYYTPFSREFEAMRTEEGVQRKGGIAPFLKRKGGTQRIEDPIIAFEKSASRFLSQAQKHSLFDYLIKAHDQGFPLGQYITELPRQTALYYKNTLRNVIGSLAQAMRKGITDRIGPAGLALAEFKGGAKATTKLATEITETAFEAAQKMYLKEIGLEGVTISPDALEDFVSFWHPEFKPPKGAEGTETIMIKNGDKLRFFEINPEINKALNTDLPTITSNPFLFPIAAAVILSKRAVQVSATTLSMPFQVANFLFRDPQTALFNQKAFNPLQLARDMLGSLLDQAVTSTGFKEDTFSNLLNRLGVASATRYGSERNLRSAMKGNPLYKYVTLPMKTLDFVENVLTFGERATRMAVAKETMNRLGIKDFNQPLTTEQAIEIINAYQRSTVNFAKQGRSARVVNMWVPFFTARLAELGQIHRAIERYPVRAAGLGMGYMALGVYNAMQNHDKTWWKETDPTYRSAYYLTTIKDEDGKDRVIGLPLSTYASVFYTLGNLAGSQVMEEGVLKPSVYEYLTGIAQNAAPLTGLLDAQAGFGLGDLLPVPVKIAFEEIMNKKFFGHRPIVPQGIQFAPPSKQFTANTSELSKSVAAALGSVFGEAAGAASPLRVEHVIQSFFPGPAKAENFIERETGIRPINERKGVPLLWSPLLRGGYASSITDRSHNSFYDKLTELRAHAGDETSEEREKRLKMNKVGSLISDLTKNLSVEIDSVKRDDLYKKRQDLFELGISIYGGSVKSVPDLQAIKEKAKQLRKEEKKSRASRLKKKPGEGEEPE